MKIIRIIWVIMAIAAIILWGMWCGYHAGSTQINQELVDNQIVPYEQYFREYAPKIGWNWELLAAVAYHESRFNPNVVSPTGARGVMQLMPKTARRFGLNDSTILIPRNNIAASVKYIERLQQQFAFIKDSVEQRKFILASYNAGPAHIHDARRLVKKYGGHANCWASVEKYLSLLSQEEFYSDSVVRYGAFNAGTTIKYVHSVERMNKKYINLNQQKENL